jgi:hypothetical protein
MNSVIDFLNRTSNKLGFKREVYNDADVPTDLDNLVIVPVFADFKYSFLLSTLLLDGFKNKIKGSKYLIVCSYPGFSHLFKKSNEFWSFTDFQYFKSVFENSNGFENTSIFQTNITRSLNENFRNVVNSDEFDNYYKNGFKDNFWKQYSELNSYYPMVPSSAVLGKDFLRLINEHSGYKIFIFPSLYLNTWNSGRVLKLNAKKEFYIELIKYLKNENIFPVIWNHQFGFDLTEDFKDGSDCLFLNEYDISKVLSAMRLTGCVLDLFSGVSWLANLARTPCVVYDERNKYFNTKEYELFDISKMETPSKSVFSFVNSIANGNKDSWCNDMFKSIVNDIINFIPFLDRDVWTTTSEFNKITSINSIRKIHNRKFGTRFIKIPKE